MPSSGSRLPTCAGRTCGLTGAFHGWGGLGCLVANGQALAYVYFEGEPGRRAAAKLLTPMRARAICAEIANLPEPLSAPGT